MRSGLVMFLLAGAMVTASIAMQELRDQEKLAANPGLDFTETASVRPLKPVGEAFILSSHDGGGDCVVVKGAPLPNGASVLKLNPECDRLMPGITQARFWIDKPDGSVAFGAKGGAAVVEFSVGDGVDYETFSPASTMLTLKGRS